MALPPLFSVKVEDNPRHFIIVMIVTFFCVIGITWVYTYLSPMRFEESGYAVWRAKFDAIESCSVGSTVILGDSRAQSAFVPEYFDRDSTNLAFGAATPLEVYLVFKKILPCLTSGKHVLISIAPIEFQKISPFLWENGVRYGFFSLGDIRELAADAAVVHDETLAQVQTRFGKGLMRDLIYGTRFPSIYFNNLVNARVMLRGTINQQLLDRAKDRRGFLPFGDHGGVISSVDEAKFLHFEPLPIDDLIFRKIIALAAQKRLVLDFIAAPLSELSLGSIAHTYQTEFASYLMRVDPTHATFRIVEPLFYPMPDSLFADNFHLKEAGANLFTTWLDRCIDDEICNSASLMLNSTEAVRNQKSVPH